MRDILLLGYTKQTEHQAASRWKNGSHFSRSAMELYVIGVNWWLCSLLCAYKLSCFILDLKPFGAAYSGFVPL